ncbi:MAG: acetyl-CoA carboxylase biotin carboxyl carrier protein [Ignavibacteria bacterium]|nr:acetyl-CoA carboxylase biotin carboxyl carrier protein [Ignavibacteria bacterium]
MDLQYLRKLLKLVNETNVDEIEIEEGGTRIRVTRARAAAASQHVMYAPMPEAHPAHAHITAPATTEAPAPAAAADDTKTFTVTSPIVGTFYRAPAPDAESYVQVGQTIAAGSTVCIIEAMKIMNEIESDRGGKVIRILAENGQPVEYNQPLFVLEIA